MRLLIVPEPEPLPPDPAAVAYFASLGARLTAPPVECAPVEICMPDDLVVVPVDESGEESPTALAAAAFVATDDEREQYEYELNEIKFRLMDACGLHDVDERVDALHDKAKPSAEIERAAADELGTVESFARRRRGEPELIEYAPGKYM